jgi:hypothetical protein
MDKKIHYKKERDKGPNQQFNLAKLPNHVSFFGQLITPCNLKVILGTYKKMEAQSLIKFGQKFNLAKGQTCLYLGGPYSNETYNSL